MLDFMFATPKRHILGRNGVFWRILRQNPSRALGCSELQEPKNKKKTNTFLVRKFSHVQKRYACADGDERLHRCMGSRRNHLCRFVWLSLTAFGRGGGLNFGLLHWLALSPLQHSRTTVRVCDKTSKVFFVLIFAVFLPDFISYCTTVAQSSTFHQNCGCFWSRHPIKPKCSLWG